MRGELGPDGLTDELRHGLTALASSGIDGMGEFGLDLEAERAGSGDCDRHCVTTALRLRGSNSAILDQMVQ